MKTYEDGAHAIQSAIAFEIGRAGVDAAAANPKHLRTGLNLAMRDHASLADLLIKKGIITEGEYRDAILEGLEKEKAQLTAALKRRYGLDGVELNFV